MDPAFPSPTPPDPSPLGGLTDVFPIVFGIAAIIVLAVAVLVVVGIVRRNARLRSLGHDPMTIEADIADRMATGRLTTPDEGGAPAAAGDAEPAEPAEPARSVEERLAEVEELHARGAIDDAERTAARARILGDS